MPPKLIIYMRQERPLKDLEPGDMFVWKGIVYMKQYDRPEGLENSTAVLCRKSGNGYHMPAARVVTTFPQWSYEYYKNNILTR